MSGSLDRALEFHAVGHGAVLRFRRIIFSGSRDLVELHGIPGMRAFLKHRHDPVPLIVDALDALLGDAAAAVTADFFSSASVSGRPAQPGRR
jgi:hypothetical protein